MNTSIAEVKKYYDEQTNRKLKDFVNTNQRVEDAWETLTSILGLNTPKQILEIGCGIGNISWRLANMFSNSQVKGYDVSEKSIEIAKKIFRASNLQYIRSDSINEANLGDQNKYDLILMMDVYEHIPLKERSSLHEFIKENLASKGFLFLSCPTPRYLNFLRKNHSSEIQPVDENIYLPDLVKLSNDTGTNLFYYKEITVWMAGDYFHAIFSNAFDLKKNQKKSNGITIINKKDLIKYVRSKVDKHHLKKLKNKEKAIRLEMVKTALGDVLK